MINTGEVENCQKSNKRKTNFLKSSNIFNKLIKLNTMTELIVKKVKLENVIII